MNRYKVTVKLTVEATSPEEATDGIGEILRPWECLFQSGGDPGLDWRIDGQPALLVPKDDDSVEGRAS